MTREEALNKIRQMSLPKETMDILEALAPELAEAESEDERIRKALIWHLKAGEDFVSNGVTKAECLAYLEKQKECVSNNFDDVWAEEDCEEIIAEGQKLTPRFKELLKEVCHAWYDRGAKLEKQKSGLSFVGDFQAKTLQGPIELAEWKEAAKIREWILAKMQELAATGVPCSDEIKMADKAIDYLIKQKEYIEEPKIAFGDWGDKEKKEAIITCLKYMRFIKKITNQEYDDLIKWLANNTISNVSEKEKCLREVKQKEQNSVDEQFPPLNGLDAIKAKYYDDGFKNGFDEGVASVKPAEWSEEDEKDMAHIIRILDDCYVYGTHDLSKTDRENLVNKLKSLRPQYHGDVTMTEAYKMGLEAGKASHWKPSEEQMEALHRCVDYLEESDNEDAEFMESLLEQLKKLM